MRRKLLAAAAALALFGPALPAVAADYAGTLAEPGVVWISDGSRPAPVAESVMRNTHKTFEPDLLVVPAGSSVRFPNDDAFFHSIYSEDRPDGFDIGFYDTGPGKVVTFALPAVVEVRCHIHGSMHATIVVVDGPAATVTKAGDRYVLANVRPGRHVLHVWTPAAGEKKTAVRV